MDKAPPDHATAGRGGSSSAGPGEGQNPLDWAREIGATDRVMVDLDRYLRRRRQRRLQFAGIAVLMLGAAAIWQPWLGKNPDDAAAAGGQIVLLQPERRGLPDGSTVELSPGAVIEVAFSDRARHVALRGGPAHFEVAKDSTRPFVVAAGGVEAQAVGTAFVVDPTAEGVAVLVTEGRVAVARTPEVGAPSQPASTPPLAILAAGEGVRLPTAAASSPAVDPVPAQEYAALLAWRVPRLKFSHTPLKRVVAMFNAHGTVPLVLGDEASGSLKVSGTLRADDPESLFRLLHAEVGLIAERRDGTWLLRKR